MKHTHHPYANNYHYHYKCVLDHLNKHQKNLIIEAGDETALISHFPYYQGLDGLDK